MSATEYEIRLCMSCGLRFPTTGGSEASFACPACNARTSLIGRYPLQHVAWAPFKDSMLHLEAILDSVPSGWDVGSIFRTAYGFGVKHLHLCGITPTPESVLVRRTANGLADYLPWSYHKDAVLVLRALKEQGFQVFGVENDTRAVSIKEIALARRRRVSDTEKKAEGPRTVASSDRLLFIFGDEHLRIDPDLLHLCDEIVYLPMQGDKKSFSAAMTFAIAIGQLVL